ncbi:MAG: TrmH family RNA methyltransferase, partial [Bilophila sp.]
PEQAAEEIAPLLLDENPIALVFGSEDRGLSNEEIEQCQRLVTIPTAGASSLNVAQAVLVMAYECMKAVRRAVPQPVIDNPGHQSRRITHEEQELLYARIRETLLAIDYLKSDNTEYFLMPLRRFLGRSGLRRHEMDMLMGICRQVDHFRK